MARFVRSGEPRLIGNPAVEVHALRKDGTEFPAEGVERSEHVRELHSLRCDLAQGFFFARPLDAGALTALLAAPDTPASAFETAAPAPGDGTR